MPWNKAYRPSANQRLEAVEYCEPHRIYFVTIRAYQHHCPFVRNELNQLVLNVLREEQDVEACSVFTYCLMPDHLHFLVSPQREGVSILTFVERYKGKSTNRSWQVGWHGKLWQPRFWDHIVRTEESLTSISEYILNNPLRKGLVERVEEWRWCGTMNPLPL